MKWITASRPEWPRVRGLQDMGPVAEGEVERVLIVFGSGKGKWLNDTDWLEGPNVGFRIPL